MTLPDGTKVIIDGSAEEVRAVLDRWHTDQSKRPKRGRTRSSASSAPKKKARTARVQLVDLIASLIDGGFFKKPKDLGSVKAALEEMGHHYPVTTLSPTMLRQVRSRNLRRLKQDRRWMYTG